MGNLKSKELSFKKVMLITIFITLFFMLGGYLHQYTFLSLIPYEINEIDVWPNVWKIIWAGLAFIFITYYNHQLPISINEMFNFKKINFKIIFAVLFVIALIDLAYSLIICKSISVPSDFNFFKSTTTYFFVGLTEEIVFRGWAMNAFSKVTSIRKANIIQSVFFMLEHLLPWFLIFLMGGNLSDIPLSFLYIQLPYCIVFGCILGRIFNKTHCLWITILIHCFNDVIATFFNVAG